MKTKTLLLTLLIILTTTTLLTTPQTTHTATHTQPPNKQLWESSDLGGDVLSIAWSPDGSKLAVGGGFDKVVVFSSSGRKLWESSNLGDRVESVAWSPDGTKLAAGTHGMIAVFSWVDFGAVFVSGSGLPGCRVCFFDGSVTDCYDLGSEGLRVYADSGTYEVRYYLTGLPSGYVFVGDVGGYLRDNPIVKSLDVKVGENYSLTSPALKEFLSKLGRFVVKGLSNADLRVRFSWGSGSKVLSVPAGGSVEVYADPRARYNVEILNDVGPLPGSYSVQVSAGGVKVINLADIANIGLLRVVGPAGALVRVSWSGGSKSFTIPASGVLELRAVPGTEYRIDVLAPDVFHSGFTSVVSVPSAGYVASVYVSLPYSLLFYVVVLGIVGVFGASFYVFGVRPRVSVRLLTKEIVEGVTEFIELEFRNSGLKGTSFEASVEVDGVEVFSGVVGVPGRSRKVIKVPLRPKGSGAEFGGGDDGA